MRATNLSNALKAPATVRCAVYTRKSTEEGLDQEFNTLDAQREAAEAYIKSQAAEGWACLPQRYDDGGFAGGTMDRPALQRLLADIRAGKIDTVLSYKVDRLRSCSKSLRQPVCVDKRNPQLACPRPGGGPLDESWQS